ncbi:MAG: preprotein translocase subunit SecE [Rickettsiales bacterium]|jgi:preprotein translocase subunit SecE|nr:preprotein translocase subunit SecE [Rickettsiales bacterium]
MLQYIKDVRLEWFKIVWPNRDAVVRSTILIFIFSAVFALFLFLVDSLMGLLVGWIF